MKIILATFAYYPYAWGGSEVYVHGLALFLKREGFDVTVVAGMPEEAFAQHLPFFEDHFLRAASYEYEGIEVIGCTNQVTTDEIYSRYNPDWKASWLHCFQKIWQENTVGLLHLHANTPLISAAFIEAMRAFSPQAKVVFSYHVPESCPKGTLLRFNREACEITPGTATCTTCVWQDRLGISPQAAQLLSPLMPNLPINKLPSLLKIRHLTRLHVEGFAQFTKHIDHWFVFSNQIRETLNRCQVNSDKISVIRHGIHGDFPDGQNPPERPASPLTFLYLGRFKKVKGMTTMLKAWLSLPNPDSYREARRQLLIIGGDKKVEPEIARLLEAATRRNDVKLLGMLDVAEVRQWLEKTHCILVPSEWVEIGPFVLHEALACGANVIASNVGGCNELANFYGEGCQTFQMGDASDLAKKIERFQFAPLPAKSSQAVGALFAGVETI